MNTAYICILTMQPEQALALIYRIRQTVGIDGQHRVLVLQQGIPSPGFSGAGYLRAWYLRDNLGCAGGRDFLVGRCKADGLHADDVVVFLDDDIVIIEPTWLDDLIAPLRAGADIAGVEGMCVQPDYWTRPCGAEEVPDYVSGGWCAVRGEVFLSGVTFDLGFHPNYFEDVALCADARAAGFRLAICTRSGLHHPAHPGNPTHAEHGHERLRLLYGGRGLFGFERLSV